MISCVYCGGEHSRAADVKRCWSGQATLLDAVPDAAPGEVPGEVPGEMPGAAPAEAATVATVSIALRRGPGALGRHVVVAAGHSEPEAWAACRRVAVDAAVLDAPGAVVETLRAASQARESLVIELAADLDASPGEVDARPQHLLGPGHTFLLDELHHLVWSNAIDARVEGSPRWALLDAAVGLGARPAQVDERGDVVRSDGTAVWLDGGPLRFCAEADGLGVVHAVQIEHRALVVVEPGVGNESATIALAADQLAAVTHDGGSARIIAPAGSGKTRVLTERARHLVGAWRLPAGALSLIAFNKRAQEEMQNRTSDLAGMSVRTLNSIALAIINGRPPFAPQPRQWRTIDEPDVRRILQRFVTVPRKLNVDPLAPWIDALSLLRLGLLDPRDVEGRYGGDVDGLADVWPHYLDALERDGVVDFDDQIRRAIHVLVTQPAARSAAQRACRVMLVDEFQDLTPAHLLLVRLLAGCGGSVFGVGDDDQTIYGYNGADPGWLIDFERWFPGAGDHPLEVNYRCPAGVVEVADRLLRHNRRRVNKTIRAASGVAGGWSIDASVDPIAATVAAVRTALDAGAPTGDVAVLTRVNATIAPVQLALTTAQVPITGGVGSEFAERTAVRAALAWLRLVTKATFAPDDLGEALRRPSRGLHPRVREWVMEQRDVSALSRLADRITNEKDATRIAEFAGDIARLQVLANGGAPTARLLATLIDEIGLGGAVASLDTSRHGMNRAAQGDDLLALRQVADLHSTLHSSPAQFESWLREQLVVRRDPNGVVLATVHRVKGQEWPHVVVHLADRDQFPHRLADDHEEERRLFHVAITRASQHVTIVTGDRPSPFVAELTSEPSPDRSHDRSAVPAREWRSSTVAPSAPSKRSATDHPLLDRDRVMAAVGLVLVDQGQEWVITALEPAAAVTERDGAIRKFALGEKVETAGRQRGALRPRVGGVDDASVLLFDALRSYRDRVRAGKPAYTVFDDKTLAAIASALPETLDALARVKGVGPAKLEQYGDDVIELGTVARRGPTLIENRLR